MTREEVRAKQTRMFQDAGFEKQKDFAEYRDCTPQCASLTYSREMNWGMQEWLKLRKKLIRAGRKDLL